MGTSMVFTTLDADEWRGISEVLAEPDYDEQSRETVARNLMPIAQRHLEAEMLKLVDAKADGKLAIPDDRDLAVLLDGLHLQYKQMKRLKMWPAPLYDEFSPERPVPRTVELVEALSFFIQTGRPALIRERRATGNRNGWLAELLVF